MASKKRPPGRPPKRASERNSIVLTVRLRPAVFKKINSKADRAELLVSALIREVLEAYAEA